MNRPGTTNGGVAGCYASVNLRAPFLKQRNQVIDLADCVSAPFFKVGARVAKSNELALDSNFFEPSFRVRRAPNYFTEFFEQTVISDGRRGESIQRLISVNNFFPKKVVLYQRQAPNDMAENRRTHVNHSYESSKIFSWLQTQNYLINGSRKRLSFLKKIITKCNENSPDLIRLLRRLQFHRIVSLFVRHPNGDSDSGNRTNCLYPCRPFHVRPIDAVVTDHPKHCEQGHRRIFVVPGAHFLFEFSIANETSYHDHSS